MANLALDFGNTHLKAASFNGSELTEFRMYQNINELLKDNEFVLKHDHAIVSSVTNDHSLFIEVYDKQISTLLFSSDTLIPIKNNYKSISTLGSDRLAASIGSYTLHPNSDVLTIDCGTCIKYNFVTKNNEYIGGGISPGLNLRFRSLNDHTAKLPLINLNEDFTKLVGQNTEESIHSGVVNGTLKEIDGIISEYRSTYPQLLTLVTGGNGYLFAKRLKNSIFAHPHLVLKGLNKILQFNIEKK